jgi:uncharacterized protein (TIGR02145 family)
MKYFLLIFVITTTISGAFAQSPHKLSYQCIVRNSSGELLTNKAIGMRISILQGSATGAMVFSETYNPLPLSNANGLVTVEIGTGLAINGNFSEIDWSYGPYFLKTETDPAGGSNYTIVGTSQLLSVPYALFAEKSGNGFSGSYPDLTNKPELFDGAWNSISGKPTSLDGYGITDAVTTSHPSYNVTTGLINNWNTAYSWGNHAGLYKTLSYIPGWTEITGKPVFSAVATTGFFSDLNSRPTTLTGYGIIDAVATSGEQSIAGYKTFTENINAGNNNITNLANPVNNPDAATKEYVDNVFKALGLVEDNFAGVVSDIDGNVYKTVKIGDQIWMAENLRTAHYNDGTPIPNITDDTEWANLTTSYDPFDGSCTGTGAFCWYDNDSATYNNDYGKLYNWYAAETGKLCPTGWHVPDKGPFLHEPTYCPCFETSGGLCDGDLMETGSTHWTIDYPCITNSTGFTALPGGNRSGPNSYTNGGVFAGIGSTGWYWNSGNNGSMYGCSRMFFPIPRGLMWPQSPTTEIQHKGMGLSVRCVKD